MAWRAVMCQLCYSPFSLYSVSHILQTTRRLSVTFCFITIYQSDNLFGKIVDCFYIA